MPVLDPAPPPVRVARRAPAGVEELLGRHADRTGLDLLEHLRPAAGPAFAAAPAAAEAAPGVLSVALPLGGLGGVGGLLPVAAGVPAGPAETVRRLLTLSGAVEEQRGRADGLEEELEDVTEQLTRSFEELALYHRLIRRMQVSRDPAGFAAECADEILRVAEADAAAVVVGLPGGSALFVAGEPLFNEIKLRKLVRAAGDHDWSRPLVRNGAACTLRGASSAALAPVREAGGDFGWIACANAAGDDRPAAPELGSVEGNLLAVVATVLGTHLRNAALFREKEQMLLEFVLGLVQTLDARDHYTRGHSERVAVVAHRLAEEMGFADADLDDVYLSGLLHDIGKIGIDDGILRKPGKLTDDEFAQIRRHPTIGYDILAGITGLQEILPGVRSHHENFDGTGYPDGLVERDIPLMARVMAVADAYDAMGSDRPYRKGMPPAKIGAIFEEGRGTQWDPAALDAYFACRTDVRRIWEAPGNAAGRLQARASRRVAGV